MRSTAIPTARTPASARGFFLARKYQIPQSTLRNAIQNLATVPQPEETGGAFSTVSPRRCYLIVPTAPGAR
jgi:hypothetical protein